MMTTLLRRILFGKPSLRRWRQLNQLNQASIVLAAIALPVVLVEWLTGWQPYGTLMRATDRVMIGVVALGVVTLLLDRAIQWARPASPPPPSGHPSVDAVTDAELVGLTGEDVPAR